MLRRAASLKISFDVTIDAAREDEARNARRASRKAKERAVAGLVGLRRLIAADLDEQRPAFVRRQVEVIDGKVAAEPIRLRVEGKPRQSFLAVQADIGEEDGTLLDDRRKMAAFSCPHGAADLEQVGKVCCECDLDANVLRPLVIIFDGQPLVAVCHPQEARPAQMDEVMLQDEPALAVEEVGIGQVAGERCVVVAQCRRQQHRALPVDRQVEVRKIARIAVEEAFRTSRAGERVAVVIEDGEGIAVLQGAWPPLLQRCGGGNEELRDRCGGFRRYIQSAHIRGSSQGHNATLLRHDLKAEVSAIHPGNGAALARTPGRLR